MSEGRKPGRPKGTTNPDRAHKRTVAFPPGLYEEVKKIADREERDVTSQIVKALKDFVAKYKQENGDDLGKLLAALTTH
jgi:hypothetical protein